MKQIVTPEVPEPPTLVTPETPKALSGVHFECKNKNTDFKDNKEAHGMSKQIKHPAVYILSNKPRGTLYIGVTSDLPKRIWEHKNNVVPGFSHRYSLHNLVYFEAHLTMDSAIVREKSLKKWRRVWKFRLIETANPEWRDLYEEMG